MFLVLLLCIGSLTGLCIMAFVQAAKNASVIGPMIARRRTARYLLH